MHLLQLGAGPERSTEPSQAEQGGGQCPSSASCSADTTTPGGACIWVSERFRQTTQMVIQSDGHSVATIPTGGWAVEEGEDPSSTQPGECPSGEHPWTSTTRADKWEEHKCGDSHTKRSEEREVDRSEPCSKSKVWSKSKAWSKSRAWNKSQVQSKSKVWSKSRTCQGEAEDRMHKERSRACSKSQGPSHSYEQFRGSGDPGDHWMGHSALEDGGAVSCATCTQVALHARTHTDHNAAQGGAATPFLPHQSIRIHWETCDTYEVIRWKIQNHS